MVELERFRKYLPREQRASGAGKYAGWLSNRRMTRRAFAEAAGIPVVTLKAIETRGVKPRPATIAKIEKLMAEIRASEQSELLDDRATRAAEKAAAKLAADKQRRLDAMLDRAMRAARRPMKKSAKQGGLF